MTIKTEVETKKFALTDIDPASYNPRDITEGALQGLKESLSSLGVMEFPVVNLGPPSAPYAKPRLVGGHQRVTALTAQGVTHIDCVVVHMDEAAEMSANLSLNNPAIRGHWDVKLALPMMEEVEATMPHQMHMGFDVLMEDLRMQAARLELGAAKAEDATEKAVESDSKPGYAYKLGKHRLLCGSFEGLDKLCKKKARACITDPPYNVAYETNEGESIKGDDMHSDDFSAFLDDMCALIVKKTTGPCYIFMSSKEMPALERAWDKAGGQLLRWMFWVKDRFTLSRGDYHHMHEPLLFGSKEGAKFKLSAKATNVLAFPKPQTNPLHPTQKPVELIRDLMERCTDVRQIVLDPFAGSGTTLAVAEELQRICYASELDVKHCDTIRKRWAEQAHGVGADWIKLTPGAKL